MVLVEGMAMMHRKIKLFVALSALAAASGCAVVPAGDAIRACELLQIATTEADLAPAWYLEAGMVLKRCGHDGAIAAGKVRACFAEARNGYRDSQECEAMQ